MTFGLAANQHRVDLLSLNPKKPMSADTPPSNEKKLREALEKDPADWETRKQLAHLLYDQGSFQEAADAVWAADEIPSIDLELAFAARVLAKASPRKAIRLLTALLEHNHGKAVQNLGLANALLHHGMVLQAARFYGAALEADPSLGNPDLEHFILWTDDEETLWGDFKERRPKLGELPWMKRDPREAMKLTSRISHHTTPVKLPGLKPAPGEELNNELYQQKPEKGAEPSPPPAVTIPLDRVDPKYRRFDSELGAPSEPEFPGLVAAGAIKELAKPNFAAASASTKPPAPSVGMAPSATLPPAPPIPANRPKPTLPPLKKTDAPK
jgi:tetratricopeptide (TPR) repeat protein